MKRRHLLRAGAGVTGLVTAGCLRLGSDTGSDSEDNDSSDNSDDTESETPGEDVLGAIEESKGHHEEAVNTLDSQVEDFISSDVEVSEIGTTEVSSSLDDADSKLSDARDAGPGTLSDLVDQLVAFTAVMRSVVDATESFNDGNATFERGTDDFAEQRFAESASRGEEAQDSMETATADLDEASGELDDLGTDTLEDEIGETYDRAVETVSRMSSLFSGMEAFTDGWVRFSEGFSTMVKGIDDVEAESFTEASLKFERSVTSLSDGVNSFETARRRLPDESESAVARVVCQAEKSVTAAQKFKDAADELEAGNSTEGENLFAEGEQLLNELESC